jgi:hypothetical protein
MFQRGQGLDLALVVIVVLPWHTWNRQGDITAACIQLRFRSWRSAFGPAAAEAFGVRVPVAWVVSVKSGEKQEAGADTRKPD